MTRLKVEDVVEIPQTLEEYNLELIRKTGCSLREISARAAGLGVSGELSHHHLKVAVIPMSCGQGIIEGFAESVASIISYLGFNVVITQSWDAGGVAEAVQGGSEILFMADDERFVAVNVRSGKVSDNGDATGRGYATGLERMCNGLEGKKVLVIGAGPVGHGAATALARLGAEVGVYDIEGSSSERLSKDLEKLGYTVEIETNLYEALDHYRIFLDACPAQDVILTKYITKETMIAAPGIPLGVEASGVGQVSARLLHDPLQIGVSTMMFDVLQR
ncbi:3-methylornithyl-N6-L-lysine dehydrogenase PylD [Desulfosporosinus nitroreducens]|uniref:3-methylornithyl-N6-L-lysine dehydrogenase PylD n=1 Tax=Desulfosporosinus nitroreducens TaxID=2018668 RepID=A0ABT8QYC2_9FIRM|nr:3-methylornithyl-N6-L-lysine dehydrogenase PylD [Desulfosporosinus nitroreducens]MCO1604293.1 3-methylornithyl-N6-L-lysine dehydrogenase PylD [Desulfosporosinus nitroreducens]MDO0825630.1 3-methylornithyl-N6-L-lysine dehydrogenase PylD [Desulfosporosinus nitroreducens]